METQVLLKYGSGFESPVLEEMEELFSMMEYRFH
jgi:hypothetical protein